MPKLKTVLGKRPRTSSELVAAPTPGNHSHRNVPFSEGFAMGGEDPVRQQAPQVYAGPKPYTRGSLEAARQLARSSAEVCAEALVIEADASTSQASTRSQLKTWSQIATDAGFRDPFSLTPSLVFTVVGVLKRAGYRSAANYLEAAKRAHIEQGHAFSIQLKHACRLATRSAKRDLGPSKQAEALSLVAMASFKDRGIPVSGSPCYPGRACLVSAWWLLREIEASHARTSHVVLEAAKRVVSLKLPNSKTDLMALGTSRSHSCSCSVGPQRLCPYHALLEQVAFAKNLEGNAEGWLFPTAQGVKPTKRGWSASFTEIAKHQGLETVWNNGAPKYTGHSARASGAVHLALARVDLWRIQLFGRWTSAAFLRYVRSAPLASLHQLSLETAQCPNPRNLLPEAPAAQEPASSEASLVPVSEEMIEEVHEDWADAEISKEFVENTSAHGKVHRVIAHSEDLHPRHWRTKCGWYFGRGMTSYVMHTVQPSGHVCKVCFSHLRHPLDDESSTSSSSSSS